MLLAPKLTRSLMNSHMKSSGWLPLIIYLGAPLHRARDHQRRYDTIQRSRSLTRNPGYTRSEPRPPLLR